MWNVNRRIAAPVLALTVSSLLGSCTSPDSSPGSNGLSLGSTAYGSPAPVTALVSSGPLQATQPGEMSPLSLSDPDGQALEMVGLSVHSALQGPLALTELEIRFHNPHNRRMEGRFQAVLPENATLSRFAKLTDGRWMEGEVVERLKANQVYDQILHQMRDPALLEQDQGNRFSARIFPIEAGGEVRLKLSYSQLISVRDGLRTYTLPLRGLPTIADFEADLLLAPLPGETLDTKGSSPLKFPSNASTNQHVVLKQGAYTPERDLVIQWKSPARQNPLEIMQAGEFYLASYQMPGVPAAVNPADRPWVLVVDTSASSAEGQLYRGKAIKALLDALPPSTKVRAVAFDQTQLELGEGSAAQVAARIEGQLNDRGYLGGTDPGLLSKLIQAEGKKNPNARVVVVTDGAFTLGDTASNALRQTFSTLPPSLMVHALVLGSRQDSESLRLLTEGRGRVVQVPMTEGFEQDAAAAVTRLARPVGKTLVAADVGAEWIQPARLEDVQPGAEALFVARVRPGATAAPSVGIDGASSVSAKAAQLPVGTFAPLLEREGYRAYIEQLSERISREPDAEVRKGLQAAQVRISVEHRVMCPLTTLLVLENEQDYQRYGLDRRALASILTVDAQGIGVVERNQPAVPVTDVVAPKAPTKTTPVTANKAKGQKDSQVYRSIMAQKPAASAPRAEPKRARADDDEASADKKELDSNSIGVMGSVGHGSGAGLGSGPGDILGAPPPEADGAAGAAPEAEEERAMGAGSFSASGAGMAEAPSVEMGSGSAVGGAMASAPSVSGSVQGNRPSPAAPPPPAEAMAGAPRASAAQPARANRQDRTQASEARPVTAPDNGNAAGNFVRPKVNAPEWTQAEVVSKEMVDSCVKGLDSDPDDRKGYNQCMDLALRGHAWNVVIDIAHRWQPRDPENPQVYEGLGQAALALGQTVLAQRAFGSLVEVAPGKPELLQRAGLLLEHTHAESLSEWPLRRALELRPDRANAYRHLALVLWAQGRHEEAAKVLEEALGKTFPQWYRDVHRVMREELGYVYRSWLEENPSMKGTIQDRARQYGVDLNRTDALRVTLAWETDANDVDLHVVDPTGAECFYRNTSTATGLQLYEDITQGLGPEVVRTDKVMAGDYAIGVNYFSAGPMGVSRGVLVVIDPKLKGGTRPHLLPFRLVEGGRDMRLLAHLTVQNGSHSLETP